MHYDLCPFIDEKRRLRHQGTWPRNKDETWNQLLCLPPSVILLVRDDGSHHLLSLLAPKHSQLWNRHLENKSFPIQSYYATGFHFQRLHGFFYVHKTAGCICQHIHSSFPSCQLGLELGIMFLVIFSSNEVNRIHCQGLSSLFITIGWKRNIWTRVKANACQV